MNLCQKPVKEKPLNLNPYTSGNSPQPLTTERLGSSQEVGGGRNHKQNTGSAQVNKTREKPPEIYSAQIWQVFHNWNDWAWLYGDGWSLSKDCLCLIKHCLLSYGLNIPCPMPVRHFPLPVHLSISACSLLPLCDISGLHWDGCSPWTQSVQHHPAA